MNASAFCDDVLVDDDPSFATVTREALASRTIEELILLKAWAGRALAAAQRVRDTISACKEGGTIAGSSQAGFFLRKSPEERRIYEQQVDSRISAMQSAMRVADEQLAQRR